MAIQDVLPKTIWVIEVPTRADDLAKRYHNQYAKQALRTTLDAFHRDPAGFKEHFQRDARQKFKHFPRKEKYKRAKARGTIVDGRRYFSTVDLVKTGRTKEHMTKQKKITAGGTAADKSLSANLIVRFPFSGGTGRFRRLHRVPKNLGQLIRRNKLREDIIHQAVTIEKMRIELQRFDEQDPQWLAQRFLKEYMKLVNNHRSGRKRTVVSRGQTRAA